MRNFVFVLAVLVIGALAGWGFVKYCPLFVCCVAPTVTTSVCKCGCDKCNGECKCGVTPKAPHVKKCSPACTCEKK